MYHKNTLLFLTASCIIFHYYKCILPGELCRRVGDAPRRRSKTFRSQLLMKTAQGWNSGDIRLIGGQRGKWNTANLSGKRTEIDIVF